MTTKIEITDQCNLLSELHVNDTGDPVRVQVKLNEIKSNYESIFSWDVHNRIGGKSDLLTDIIDKIGEKCDIYIENQNVFDLHKFYYKLIISFEFYNNGNCKKSLDEIKCVIKSLDSCIFDDSYVQYKNAFNHIAHSTYAYIALSLNIDPKKILENIVPMSDFCRDTKAAICAIKAYVFMEYGPKGNEISLEYADEACGLCPAEPEWIKVWLIAKGRVRRFYYNSKSKPDENEIVAAETLLSTKIQKAELFMVASTVFSDMGYCCKQYNSHPNSEWQKYTRRAAEIMEKAIMLAKNDIATLSFCFQSYIFIPKQYRSQQLIDEMIEKLKNVNYYYVNHSLGKYYFKEKDYKKAKEYFTRGMISGGTFSCTLQLLRVECYLQPVEQYPYVQTLNSIYEVFVHPKRRLVVLVHILYYYCYVNNPKEVMRNLKLYMDQDISDEIKKLELNSHFPLFNYPEKYQRKLLSILTTYVEHITTTHNCWDTEEKKIVNDTLDRFDKMRQIITTKNELRDDHKKNSRDNNENKLCFKNQENLERDEKSSWFKKQDISSTSRSMPTQNEKFVCYDNQKNYRENNDDNWRFNKQQKHEKYEKFGWFKKPDKLSNSQTQSSDETIN